MPKMDVSVSVEKSGYDLVLQLATLVKAVKAAGGFTASAIPAEVVAAVAVLPSMVADVQSVKGDLAEDAVAFEKGVGIAFPELVAAIKG